MQLFWGYFFSSYLFQIPILLIWLVGIGLALARWQKHPRISMLALIALILSLGRALVYPLLQYLIIQSNSRMEMMGLLNGLLGFGSALLAAVAWGLVLAAIFSRRDAEAQA